MDCSSALSVLLCLVVIICSVAECGRLNDYILDYQPLTYDKTAVHRNHQRVRRSADSHLFIKFSAFGKNFHLKLSPAEGIFGPDHQVHVTDKGLRSVDTSFIYQGQVKGVPRSSVHLSIHNGSLEGQVNMPETTYHIEPATKYIQGPSFHTIIYPETHLDTDPYRVRRKAEAGSCGVDHVHDFLEEASRLEEEPSHVRRAREAAEKMETRSHNIYSEYNNRDKRSTHWRHKRELGQKNACPLHMRADPLLFQYYKNTKHGRVVSDEQAEEEIVAFFADHVKAISDMYSRTVFQTYDRKQQNAGLTFVIHRSTIMKPPCSSNNLDQKYCENIVDVSNYLDLTSRVNHNLYCLVFTFTYRDFSGGTLGLAWVATENNAQSGVCGQYSTYAGGTKKSLNTGIVTTINFGKTVPNRVSQLTFAHEAGHNFGSPHDIGSEDCAPFGTSRSDASNGNYIMFPSATSGNKLNNDKFSKCSRDNMTRIIQQVVDSKREMCFVASKQAFCGNKITEKDEQCDCGFGECDSTTCCVGRLDNDVNVAKACKLTDNSQCSPESGPCCNSTCGFKEDDVQCAADEPCKEPSRCNGTDFKCPEPEHKPNNTYCDDARKVCSSGDCIGSLCSIISWEECFSTLDTGGTEAELCFVSCRNPVTEKCISSTNQVALNLVENVDFKNMLTNAAKKRKNVATPTSAQLPVELPAGSPCDNFRGYCDTISKCQGIDSQGPFNQLTNMIFNPVTLNLVKEWIVEHWWAVLLMAVGLVVFLGVFIKVFGYNTPSQDPKRQQQRQRQQQQQQQQQQPQSRQQPPRNAQPSRQQGRTSTPPSYSTGPPPSYHTGMDMNMSQYDRPSQAKYDPYRQYDRLAPGYGKNHM